MGFKTFMDNFVNFSMILKLLVWEILFLWEFFLIEKLTCLAAYLFLTVLKSFTAEMYRTKG